MVWEPESPVWNMKGSTDITCICIYISKLIANWGHLEQAISPRFTIKKLSWMTFKICFPQLQFKSWLLKYVCVYIVPWGSEGHTSGRTWQPLNSTAWFWVTLYCPSFVWFHMLVLHTIWGQNIWWFSLVFKTTKPGGKWEDL